MELISREKLMETAGITAGEYSDDVIDQFINEFKLTEESVKTLNTSLLIKAYAEKCKRKQKKDYSYLFQAVKDVKKDAACTGIRTVGAYFNYETNISSVLYDLKERKKYFLKQGFIFNDVRESDQVEYNQKDVEQLLEIIQTYRVYEWESGTMGDNKDYGGQTFSISIEYEDGTLIPVSVEGHADDVHEGYAELVNALFG